MAKTAMTHARLTPEIKEKAETILKEPGISISAAYEMFYRQIIAHRGKPGNFFGGVSGAAITIRYNKVAEQVAGDKKLKRKVDKIKNRIFNI